MRLFLYFCCNMVNLFLVKLFTIEPEVISGNGNLGIIFVFTGILLLVLFILELIKFMKEKRWIGKNKRLLFAIAIVVIMISSYFEYLFVMDLVGQLGGPPDAENSRIYRYSWLNQYTNTIYLNVYTYCMVLSFVVVVYLVSRWNKIR
ncbi:hypothetical protein [Gracilibacillus salinarum]|uniref:Uncharacterized protein n=1 Tax=Gracilibacillus salinarum TaxID=2932255 RepID=A0ABY4GPI5_9BACI|nr:hypothetical protein [Gracilibacillus salinarum]UOQ86303.1 hypothetical protein MUN87_05275 [Gracilibacillus salinarum]